LIRIQRALRGIGIRVATVVHVCNFVTTAKIGIAKSAIPCSPWGRDYHGYYGDLCVQYLRDE
jgi:hypothetical protein